MNWKLYAAVGGVVVALSLVFWWSCSGSEDPRAKARPHIPDADELAAQGGAPPPVAPQPGAAPAAPAGAQPAAAPGQPPAPNPALATKPPPATSGWNLPLPTGPGQVGANAEIRRRTALIRMARIAQALNDYAAVNKTYPPQASYRGDQPLLSWRVLLLPYLGHGDLYAKFKLDEPWDSPTNAALAEKIPPVYQSPDHADDRTNFLAPHGKETFFQGKHGVVPSNAIDGVATTVLLVEADNGAAVTWTEPRDLPVVMLQPVRGIGKLRGDGVFVAFGDGYVGMLPISTPANEMTAAFTAFGEEGISLAKLYRPASPLSSGIAGGPIADEPVAEVGTPAAVAPGAPMPTSATSPIGTSPAPSVVSGLNTPEALSKLGFAAIANGKPTEGFQLLYASMLTSETPSPQFEKMRWIPALKRPALGVRWGVGIQLVGRDAPQPITWPGRPRSARQIKIPSDVTQYVGEVGERVLERMCDMSETGRFGPLWQELAASTTTRGDAPLVAGIVARESTRKAEPIAPGYVYVGGGTLKQLVDAARQEGLDALVVFEVELKPIRGGSAQTTTVHLVDLLRSEILISSAPLNTLAVRRTRETEPGADDPVVVGLERVFNYLQQNYAAADLPAEVKPERVDKRVDTLAAEAGRDPMSLLAEAKFYHQRKLLTDEKLLAHYRRVLGDIRGSQLFLGAFPQRLAALNELVPQYKPGAVTAPAVFGNND